MPVGKCDFKVLRDSDLYFVDKSMIIHEILRSGADVTLFTRPRRFGKTLNLSMTDCYLNIKYAGEPDRFEGLKISEVRPNDPEKNSNYVINIDFKDLKTRTSEIFETSFRNTVINLFGEFPELKGSDKLSENLRRRHTALTEGTADHDTLTNSIRYLCQMIEAYHGKKPIVLIDEYDKPINETCGKGKLHEDVVGFLREVFSNALKDNEHLRFAILTGVMDVSKESIFSGLNSLEVDDVFSTQYDEMFGFTQEEVEWLLRENHREDRISEVKEWYDGYRFGTEDVYNPWSVINYVDENCVAAAYWVNTSSNSIIKDLLERTDQGTWRKLDLLSRGETVEINVKRNIAYCDLVSTDDTIFSVMAVAGYLNAVPTGNGYEVSLPNKEIRDLFMDKIVGRFGEKGVSLVDFIGSMKSGDVDGMARSLRELMETLSQRILTSEFPYEAFIAGLVAFESGNYEILADHESGNGYYDIRMKRISGPGANILLEIKRRNENNKHKTMERLAREALKQIHDKQYDYGLKGETILYGVAFDGKFPTILMERHDPRQRWLVGPEVSSGPSLTASRVFEAIPVPMI